MERKRISIIDLEIANAIMSSMIKAQDKLLCEQAGELKQLRKRNWDLGETLLRSLAEVKARRMAFDALWARATKN